MQVNCSLGVLPLVYPINVEFAYISWLCLQKGSRMIHLDKMGLFETSLRASGMPTPLCSPAAF